MKLETLNSEPHRRFNILTNSWVLVSPHRTKRPWQGKVEDANIPQSNSYDENCYLCPGNERAGGHRNEEYTDTYVFTNDFAALKPTLESDITIKEGLLRAESEKGLCKVICFSPDHSLTIPQMERSAIENVIRVWQVEYAKIGAMEGINYVQIFENKGEVMGCSNPHPHGQIWSNRSLPNEPAKEQEAQLDYFKENGKSLLGDYLKQELSDGKRIVIENEHFVALVPFWAVWPFETMILPKAAVRRITELDDAQVAAYADILKGLTIRYDNLFRTSFPYSSGIHQAPTDGEEHPEWQMHMHFYPPLLRSATVKKFMVGYEMLGYPQRDFTAEYSAKKLRDLSDVHYLEE